jgi:PAX-interacting protein 1
MIVPQTADGFRAKVNALRSLDESKGVSFRTFSLPEDRCVRLLLKNVGRNTPKEVVREELEILGIRVQGVLQLRSGRRDQETAKARPLTPHFIVSIARGPEVAKVRSLTELCGLRISVETYAGPLQCKRCQRFGHTQRYCGYAPRCFACGEAHL